MQAKNSWENARKFLTDGNKVKITVRFRGREVNNVKMGENVLNKFIQNIMDKIASYNIYASSQENNTITFSCDSVPTIDVEFYVKWQDVIWIPNEITFTINGNSYTAERGMNWEQWCNSEYNTEGWTIQSMASGSYLYMVVKNSNGVGIDSTNEKIVENKAYITSSVIQEPV